MARTGRPGTAGDGKTNETAAESMSAAERETGRNPAATEPARRPRTARGERTRRALLDAAKTEFGEQGFQGASITSITRRAGTALGSFYTYFESKDSIFRAVVNDMSAAVAGQARSSLAGVEGGVAREQAALSAFLRFVREHKEVYRIIDEAEFVDAAAYRAHYETTAGRIAERLRAGAATGDLKPGIGELQAWAIMGMNVFLGLRYAVWSDEMGAEEIADMASDLLANGIAARKDPREAD